MDDDRAAPRAATDPSRPDLAVASERPGRRALTIGLLVAVLALFGFVAWELFRPDPARARIDAAPPGPTPAGYHVVTADDYRFAVPLGWKTETLDPADFGAQVPQPGGASSAAIPGADPVVPKVSDFLDGAPTLAFDPVTRDRVEAIRVDPGVVGDPSDPTVVAELRDTAQSLGRANGPIHATSTDVHGFPAARLQMETVVQNQPLTVISTVIQTGDHAFQLVVTSRSGPRAGDLSLHIVPTFAPR